MKLSPTATYKGRRIMELTKDELIEALGEQIHAARFMMRFVDIEKWHKHLIEEAKQRVGLEP